MKPDGDPDCVGQTEGKSDQTDCPEGCFRAIPAMIAKIRKNIILLMDQGAASEG